VLDIFARHLAGHETRLVVHAGDILFAPPPNEPINVLFVDLAKNERDQWVSAADLFPETMGERRYGGAGTPIRAPVRRRRLTSLPLSRGLSEAEITRAIQLPIEEQIAVLLDAARRMKDHPLHFSLVTAAWLVFEKDGLAAEAYLDDLERTNKQPWISQEPYTEIVRRAMRSLGDKDGAARL
jgi:hypothetical protein